MFVLNKFLKWFRGSFLFFLLIRLILFFEMSNKKFLLSLVFKEIGVLLVEIWKIKSLILNEMIDVIVRGNCWDWEIDFLWVWNLKCVILIGWLVFFMIFFFNINYEILFRKIYFLFCLFMSVFEYV